MYTFTTIAILVAVYAAWVARNAHWRIDNPPRSFHFTLSESRNIDYSKGESVADRARIKFYVLYLSGKRVFFDEHTFNKINIHNRIDTDAKIGGDKSLLLHSWGDAVRFGYLTNSDNNDAEQEEGLHLSILSLPKSPGNQRRIEKYLKQNGWKLEKALSFDDMRIVKGALEVYITYIS